MKTNETKVLDESDEVLVKLTKGAEGWIIKQNNDWIAMTKKEATKLAKLILEDQK